MTGTELAAADSNLAERIRAGDAAAERELFVRFQSGVRAVIVHVTGSFAAAEDLSQETFVVTLKRLRAASLEEPAKLAAFVGQTARNLALVHMRKERRRRTDTGGDDMEEIVDGSLSQEAHVHAEACARAVREWLSELRSDRDREILTRHYLKDEDKNVICRELGISPPTFNVVLYRARQRFLEILTRRGIGREDVMGPLSAPSREIS
jgi:RNA polymerase sigma-70 factor (ECF subfamily)